jgi:hypothetical protein
MNKAKVSKDIKKNQAGVEDNVELGTNNNDSAIDHALAAVNVADLGVSIIGELRTLIGTIDALAKGREPTEDGARKQLDAIRRLARFASLFAAERGSDYSLTRDDSHDALAALKGGAK